MNDEAPTLLRGMVSLALQEMGLPARSAKDI